MSEDADRDPDPSDPAEEGEGRAAGHSPRLLLLIALGLLVALGIAAKAGADSVSDAGTSTTTSSTTEVGTTSTSTVGSATTITAPIETTTTGTTVVPPVAAALAGPSDPTVIIEKANDSIYDVTVHIVEATPGAHTLTLAIDDSPPESHDFADGSTFEYDLNSNKTDTLLVPNLPAGWLTAVSGDGCPTIDTPFEPQVGTTTCDYTFSEPATIQVVKTAEGGDGTFDFTEPLLGDLPVTTSLLRGISEYDDVPPGTYHLAELALPDWTPGPFTGDCAADGTITVVPGEVAQCVKDNVKKSNIVIQKVTDPPTSTLFDFTDTGDLPAASFRLGNGDLRTFPNVPADETYTFTEAGNPAYVITASGTGCSFDAATRTVTIVPQAGETVTCTFTNRAVASISIDKVTDPSGDPTSFAFGTTGGLTPATFNLTDTSPPQVFTNVTPGQPYTITEAVPPGWSLVTSGTGCTATTNGVTVVPTDGEAVSCVFTDTKVAMITIDKTAVGGDGTFSFTAPGLSPIDVTTSGGTGSGQFVNVPPGTYDIDEAIPAGWIASTFNGDCGLDGSVTVAAGQSVTCGVTDTKLATIDISKVTNPPGDPTLFDFTLNGVVPFQLADGQSQSFDGLVPGPARTITENVPPGWALSVSGVGCSFDQATSTATVVPGPGTTTACTFTNTKLATITIDKTTVGGDGTFIFTGGPGGTRQITTSGGAGSTTYADVTPGTYLIRETAQAGWAASSFGGDCERSGTVVVPAGANLTCSITNTKLATINISKVTDPAGDPTLFDFIGAGLVPGSFQLADGGTQSFGSVVPGSTYLFAEQAVAGWSVTASGTGCAFDQSSRTVSVTPAPGSTTTCTFTNTKLATINIDLVTRPSGDPTSFAFTTSGLSPASFSLTDAAPPQQFTNVAPNRTYTITQLVPPGWSLVTDATECLPITDGVSVTPVPGDNVTCVFTDTKLATITIQKTATGGDGTFDITESALGTRSITTGAGTGSATYDNVPPGSYAFAETPIAGWLAGPFGGDCGATGSITVSPGQTATCTITNAREATIVIRKQTVPAADPTSFAFNASNGLTPATFQLFAGGSQSFTAMPGQSYEITESSVVDWTLTSVSGTGCSSIAGGVSVTPMEGETVTCTFTNTKLVPVVPDQPVSPAAVEDVTSANGSSTGFAFTGSRSGDLASLAAVLLACGLGTVVVTRRRRHRARRLKGE
jgi:hypothetical protein